MLSCGNEADRVAVLEGAIALYIRNKVIFIIKEGEWKREKRVQLTQYQARKVGTRCYFFQFAEMYINNTLSIIS